MAAPQAAIESLQKQNAEDQTTIENLQKQVTEVQATNESLRQQNAEDQTTIESLRKQHAEDQGTIERLRKQNAEDQTTIESLRKEHAEDQGTIESLRQQSAKDQGTIESLRKQHEEDQVTTECLRQKSAEDQGTLNSLRNQNSVLSEQVENKRCGADLLNKLSGDQFFEKITAIAREKEEFEKLADKIQLELQGQPTPLPDPSRLKQLMSDDNRETLEGKFLWLDIKENANTLIQLRQMACDVQKQVQEEQHDFEKRAAGLFNEATSLCLQKEAQGLKVLQEEHIRSLQTKSVKVAETVESDSRWKYNDTVLIEEGCNVEGMSNYDKEKTWMDEQLRRIRDRQDSAKRAGECLLKRVLELEGSLIQEAQTKCKELVSVDDNSQENFTNTSNEAKRRVEEANCVISMLNKSSSSANDLYKKCENEVFSVQRKFEDNEKQIQDLLSQARATIKEASLVTNQMCFYRCRRIELKHVKEDIHERKETCEEELPRTLQAWESVQLEAKQSQHHVKATIKSHTDEVQQHMREFMEAADESYKVAIAILGRAVEETNEQKVDLESSIEGVTLQIKDMSPSQFDTKAAYNFKKGERKHLLEKFKAELNVLRERQDSIQQLRREAQNASQKFLELDKSMCQVLKNSMTPNIHQAEASYELFELWRTCAAEHTAQRKQSPTDLLENATTQKAQTTTDLSENAIQDAMKKMREEFMTELNKVNLELHIVKQENRELKEQRSTGSHDEPSIRSAAEQRSTGSHYEPSIRSAAA